MKVRMKAEKPGQRPDGRGWPAPGGEIELSDAEGRALVDAGEAEEVKPETVKASGKTADKVQEKPQAKAAEKPAAKPEARKSERANEWDERAEAAAGGDGDDFPAVIDNAGSASPEAEPGNHPEATGPGNAGPDVKGPGHTRPGNHPELEPRFQDRPRGTDGEEIREDEQDEDAAGGKRQPRGLRTGTYGTGKREDG